MPGGVGDGGEGDFGALFCGAGCGRVGEVGECCNAGEVLRFEAGGGTAGADEGDVDGEGEEGGEREREAEELAAAFEGVSGEGDGGHWSMGG